MILTKARETVADNHATFLRRFSSTTLPSSASRWRRWPILPFPSPSLSLSHRSYHSINASNQKRRIKAKLRRVSSRFRRYTKRRRRERRDRSSRIKAPGLVLLSKGGEFVGDLQHRGGTLIDRGVRIGRNVLFRRGVSIRETKASYFPRVKNPRLHFLTRFLNDHPRFNDRSR